MLDSEIKMQVREIFSNLVHKYTLVANVNFNHPDKENFISLLEDFVTTSPNLSLIVNDGEELELKIMKDDSFLPITFKAIPTGHEFSTLLLLILNCDGKGKNIPDDILINKIKSLKGSIKIKSFISLTCTNCPDVVQAINLLSIFNNNIKHEIIDGAINKSELEKYSIQAVPTVYSDDKLLSVGKISLIDIINRLDETYGSNIDEVNKIERKFDVIVAGGGPAGVTAAIYAARKGFNVAIVADRIGGQVLETSSIENLISTPLTTGTKLGADLMTHLKEYPITILDNRKIVDFKVDSLENKIIDTNLNESIISKYLIITTGASWRKLNIPGESKYIGHGVAFCTHCDGPFYKNKRVVVIGGGNSGLEAAIDLANIAKHVTVLEFLPTLKGDIVLQEKLKKFSNVDIITNAQTLEIIGDDSKVNSILFKHRETSGEIKLDTDGVFIQIGLVANSNIFGDAIETNKIGEIIVDERCRTSSKGIYAAGDATTVPYKQIVIAMGEGAKAALSVFEDSLRS